MHWRIALERVKLEIVEVLALYPAVTLHRFDASHPNGFVMLVETSDLSSVNDVQDALRQQGIHAVIEIPRRIDSRWEVYLNVLVMGQQP